MRFHVTLLLFYTPSLCCGQAYNRCTIYRYTKDDTSSIIEQVLNNYGKPVEETTLLYPGSSAIDIRHTDFSYSNDTMLTKSAMTAKSNEPAYPEDSLANIISQELYYPVDTYIILNTYNNKNQLVIRKAVSYENDISGCSKLSSRSWQDTVTIIYSYDNLDRLTEEKTIGYYGISRPVNKILYEYDVLNRISNVSKYSIQPFPPDSEIFISTVQYTYKKNEYIAVENIKETSVHPYVETDTIKHNILHYNKGKITSETRRDKYGESIIYYSYHPQQRIDKEEYISDGIIKETTVYVYEYR